MTNTYNTGNPVGSTDPRDLYDNASNFDEGMNAIAPSFTDRKGVLRKAWSGMETEFNLAQSGRTAEFQTFLESSGFVSLGNYASGIEFTAYNQYIAFDGFFYRPAPSSVPFVTSGTWSGDEDKFVLLSADDVLRQDLADPEFGASIVGLERAPLTVAVANAQTMKRAMDASSISIWEFIGSITDRPDPYDMSTWDWSDAVNAAIQYVADNYVRAGLTYGKSIYVPALGIAGGYKLRKPINVKRSGINFIGEGSLTSVFTADSALASYDWAILLRNEGSSGNVGGCSIYGIGLDLNNIDVGGVNFEDAYDCVIIDDLRIAKVHDSRNGFRMGPRTDGLPGLSVSQTISVRNLFVYKASADSSTVPPISLIRVQEAQFIGSKAWAGGYGAESAQGNTPAWYLEDCRSVVLTGCTSYGAADHGVHVRAETRNSVGVCLYGHLYENCNGALRTSTSNYALYKIQQLVHDLARRESPNSGGFTFDGISLSTVNIGSAPAEFTANTEQTVVWAQRVPNVIFAAANTTNVVRAHPNALDGFQGTSHHLRVIRASTPQLQMGRDDTGNYAFTEWSSSSSLDNGIRIGIDRASDGGGRLNLMTLLDAISTNQTSMSLLINTGAGATLRRVTVGAVDSGGAGFRTLRVPN